MNRSRPEPPYVFVSGVGPVTPLGFGLEDLQEGIARLLVTHGTEAGPLRPEGPGKIPPFDLGEFLDTPYVYEDLRSRATLAAGTLALDSAYVLYDEVKADRCGLALAAAPEPRPAAERTASPRPGETTAAGHGASPDGGPEEDLLGEDVAAELRLHGYRWLDGAGRAAGARALEAAWRALKDDRADLMLAGATETAESAPEAPAPRCSQAAGMILLETQDSLERREGYAFCELGSVVCRSVEDTESGTPAEALRSAVEEAIRLGGIWQGDVGAVFPCSDTGAGPAVREAEAAVLQSYTQVPRTTASDFVGDTGAAAFPFECILASEVLLSGELPPRLAFVGEQRGVEMWVRGEQSGLLGFAGLVIAATGDYGCAAVLKAL